MGRECRAALRSLTKRRALAATVILTLALGIGANAAIFSAVDAVLLRPLPFPDADRLVRLYELNLTQAGATHLVAPTRIEAWNQANRSFDAIAGSYFENLTDLGGTAPERVEAMRTSPRFFAVLGVPPALGRLPTAVEDVFGGPRIAVLSDSYWRARFGADPAIIGRSWTIGGAARTIVAVMPPSFKYPTATTQVWIPAQAPAMLLQARQARFYTAVARLAPGVSIAQARDDLNAIQARLGEQYPETDRNWGAEIVPLHEEQVAGVRRSLWLLFGAVALVLVAACGNVACLMLADAARREHEVAIRFALGASRRQVVRQLLVEGALLALAGAAVGLVAAYWLIGFLGSEDAVLPAGTVIRIDGRLIVFTLTLGVLSTIGFALAPAVRATRRSPLDALSRGGRSQAGGRHVLQRALVAAQVCLAIVLLVGAGLLVRSVARLQAVSSGIEAANILTFRMSAQWTERADAVVQRQARTLARLEAIPGVQAAALAQHLPISIDYPPGEFQIVGRDARDKTFAHGRAVSAGYFRTLHIPVLDGATCSSDPAQAQTLKVLVTKTFAERFFAGERPIGRSLTAQGFPAGTVFDIIGVVGDVRERGLTRGPEPIIYYCGFSGYWPDPFFMARVDPFRPASVTAIRAALREIEPARAMYAVRPLPEVIASSISQQRLNGVLLTLFAATALGLASLGLYGVLAQLLAARRREIGVRIALGAAPARIVRAIAAQAAIMTGVGIAAGLACAFGVARVMNTLIYDISTRDPLTFAVVPIVLAIVAAAAAFVPARRASRVDPVEILRQ
jgi:putative ABC transport system permease protein